jgi:mono/diheme cytochrome c family protein
MKFSMGLLVCTLLLGVTVWAQSDADYSSWMKSNAATAASLGKNLTAKAGDAAAMDAKTLQDNMTKVAAYWQAKNVGDAVKFAQDAKSGFAQVAALASAGKFDDATAAMKMAQTSCGGCHMAHRERAADGTFSMK